MSAIFDEWYAEDISQRAKDSVIYRKKQGITIGIPPLVTERDENNNSNPLNLVHGCYLMGRSHMLLKTNLRAKMPSGEVITIALT